MPLSKNVPFVTESTEITDEYRGKLNEIDRGDLGNYAQKFDFTKISETEFIEHATLSTLPRMNGQRHHKIFELCRWLKAIPRFQHADARSPELELILRKWHQRALPFIRTKDFDESMIDFRKGWGRVKFPKGQEPMNEIVQRAFQSEFPRTNRNYDSETVRGLILICRELQRVNPSEPFYLSCRKAGELLDTYFAKANRGFFLLENDGILRKVGEHKKGSMKAQRYRYLLSLE